MLIALQRVHTASILRNIIIASEGSSRLTTLSGFPSFPLQFLQLVGELWNIIYSFAPL
jgi:hypothetical protein